MEAPGEMQGKKPVIRDAARLREGRPLCGVHAPLKQAEAPAQGDAFRYRQGLWFGVMLDVYYSRSLAYVFIE